MEEVSVGQRSMTEELQSQRTKTTTFLRKLQQKSQNSTSPKSQKTEQNVRLPDTKQWSVTPWVPLVSSAQCVTD